MAMQRIKTFLLNSRELMEMKRFYFLHNVGHGSNIKVCLRAPYKTLVQIIINGKIGIPKILVLKPHLTRITCGILHRTNGKKKTNGSLLKEIGNSKTSGEETNESLRKPLGSCKNPNNSQLCHLLQPIKEIILSLSIYQPYLFIIQIIKYGNNNKFTLLVQINTMIASIWKILTWG